MLLSPQLIVPRAVPIVAAGGARGPVTWDATGATAKLSGTGQVYTAHTVGAGLTNGALILIVAELNNAAVSAVAADWDHTGTPQTMFPIGNVSSGNTSLWLFGLRNPTSGNKQAQVTWTGAGASMLVCGISFQAVTQVSDAAAFAHFNSLTGSAGSPSVTVTSAVGDFAIGAFIPNDAARVFNSVTGNQIFLDNTGNFAAAANYDTGAASVVLTGTTDAAPTAWAACGFDLVGA